jgi:hypothetical protein
VAADVTKSVVDEVSQQGLMVVPEGLVLGARTHNSVPAKKRKTKAKAKK